MLDLKNLSNQFDFKKDAIITYKREISREMIDYQNALSKINYADVELNKKLPKYSGAKLLEEGELIKKFKENWNSRSEAIEWVDKILSGVNVGGVDGSQIYPDKNFEIPIAAVQICTVHNKHTIDKNYHIAISTNIITPDEFEKHQVYAFGKDLVDARRFADECNGLIKLMQEHKKIYTLLDGTLVVSHIKAMNQNIKDIYIKALKKLFRASYRTRNPIIGYVDTSQSRDLVLMMSFLFNLTKTNKLLDSILLEKYLNWGDRTKAFLCDRDDRHGGKTSVLDMYDEFRDGVAFFYIRMSRGLPNRVEFPRWIVEVGETEKIANIVRAETILRGDYPDILLRAHEMVAIKEKEHNLFFGMLENFCKIHGIPIKRSAKWFHKGIRL
ncbi:MAG TPA: DNA double-strand break repair nuclease NurA [Methanosarcinales archaeon]|nr:DNA double-strand break repair nuclease NurA [Methanosarcinales archaeon]